MANTGDGIVAAEKLGAALDVMEDAWWGPTIPLPNGPWFALSERNAPGSIIVNAAGQRYMNEALPYVEATHRMYGGTMVRDPVPARTCPPGGLWTSSAATGICLRDYKVDSGFRASGWNPASS